MAIYKVSYVVAGDPHPGAILNQSRRPELGEVVRLGMRDFKIIDVFDLVPARGEFVYVHVTCRPLQPGEQS